MTDSNTTVANYKPGDSYATPHSEVEGKLTPIEPARIDNTAPAGAINSSATDMAKWVAADCASTGGISVGHAGGLPGYVSQVTLIPDMKLGVVVLTNQEAGGMFTSVTYRAVDRT
ncbi:MAG: hypothetical protein ABSH50_08380 [Bryobacteraceae bacterium]|jgi:hypothetical protein